MAGTDSIDFVANGSTAGNFSGSLAFSRGGKLAFAAVAGTWNSASVQFQMLFKGTWVDVGAAVTENAAPQVIELPPCQLRAAVTGSGFSGLYASAVVVPTITTR